ncbi:MAG: flagellar M-ring protein FliF [Thermotogaceae bacterium]|nr:flagellar M-ring protein FliF [Thermotogaceae bacterium]
MNNFLENLKKFYSKTKEWWSNLSSAQKMLMGGATIAVIVAIIAGIIFAANPPYALLIGGISDEEAGNITKALDEMGIPYKVDAGNRIYIPVKYNIYEVRMKLASSGVIGSSIKGFELIEQGSLGATSFDKQVRYQIALQGELARTIVTIKGVKAARVHLVLPKYTYYVRGGMTKPRASVFVELEPGIQLTTQQIKGIMELVAGAVEGLDLKDVKVIDQYSHVLSDRVISEEEMMMASTKMELKMKLEQYYREKIEKPLERVFGTGRVEVITDINFDWEKLEREMKKYEKPDKKGGLIRSQQTETEKAENISPTGGAPGTESNVPPGYSYITGSSTGTYERSSNITNYELNEIYEKLVQNKEGEIKAISVSVIVDASSSNLETMSSDMRKKLADEVRSILLAGIGASATLTELAVTFLPFDRTEDIMVQKFLDEMKKKERFRYFAIGMMLITVVSFLLVYLLILQIRRVKSRKFIEARKLMLEEEIKKLIEEQKEETVEEELTPEMKELQDLREALQKSFEKDPSEIAYIIRMWISGSS